MNHAYFVHHAAVRAYKEAKTPFEKQIVAVNYFELNAEIVDSEMKRKLEGERK